MYRSNHDLSDDPIFSHELNIFSDNHLRPMQVISVESEGLLDQWQSGFNGFTTGLKDLDDCFHLVPGELTIIGGMSSMGKTVLGMQIMKEMARQIDARREIVTVFSAEMSGAMLELRMASGAAGVNLHHLRLGKGSDADFKKVRDAKETIRTLPIWMDDSKRPTTLSMMNKLKEQNDLTPIRGMLFDFMELAGDENESEERRVAHIGQALSGIAQKLQIPVIALSQLNEKANDRANKMPSINDLRYSRTLTHIADNIILPLRPAYYIERGMPVTGLPPEHADLYGEYKDSGLAYIMVGKQRNGENRLVPVVYDKTLTRFRDADLRRAYLNDF